MDSPPANENNDLFNLSGTKPFFSIILSKTHVSTPYRLLIPAEALPHLPKEEKPMKLTYNGVEWPGTFCGHQKSFEVMWGVARMLALGKCPLIISSNLLM